MQEGRVLSDREINRDLLRPILATPRWFWIAVALLGLVVLAAMSATGYMVNRGLGVTGLNRPVMWGFFITNFVFWIGISHAGVMLSAILRLSKAEWRRPATRAAEVLTVFSLMTAMTMPLIHTGRPWRALYWIFPYDFSRGIWPSIRSPLIWDPRRRIYLPHLQYFVCIRRPASRLGGAPRPYHWCRPPSVLGAQPGLAGQSPPVEAPDYRPGYCFPPLSCRYLSRCIA